MDAPRVELRQNEGWMHPEEYYIPFFERAGNFKHTSAVK